MPSCPVCLLLPIAQAQKGCIPLTGLSGLCPSVWQKQGLDGNCSPGWTVASLLAERCWYHGYSEAPQKAEGARGVLSGPLLFEFSRHGFICDT